MKVPAQVPVTLVVNTRRNAKEITLQIDKGQTFGQGPIFKDNQEYVEDLCLPSGRHRLKFFDTFGDGWSGGYWSLKNADGKLFGGGPTAGQVAGTGGEVAFNVDEKNPGSMAVETRVRLHIKTGRGYSNRVCRWNIDGGTNFGSKLRPNHHYFFSFKLPSGKHKLNMVGTKQGRGQGAWFELQEDRKDTRGRTTRKTVLGGRNGGKDKSGLMSSRLKEVEFCLGTACDKMQLQKGTEMVTVQIRPVRTKHRRIRAAHSGSGRSQIQLLRLLRRWLVGWLVGDLWGRPEDWQL
jgi:hypothetical protein